MDGLCAARDMDDGNSLLQRDLKLEQRKMRSSETGGPQSKDTHDDTEMTSASVEDTQYSTIRNGDDLDATKYAWTVMFKLTNEATGFCTGSFIGPDEILSAAHCFDKPEDESNWRSHQLVAVDFVSGRDRTNYIKKVMFPGKDIAVVVLEFPRARPQHIVRLASQAEFDDLPAYADVNKPQMFPEHVFESFGYGSWELENEAEENRRLALPLNKQFASTRLANADPEKCLEPGIAGILLTRRHIHSPQEIICTLAAEGVAVKGNLNPQKEFVSQFMGTNYLNAGNVMPGDSGGPLVMKDPQGRGCGYVQYGSVIGGEKVKPWAAFMNLVTYTHDICAACQQCAACPAEEEEHIIGRQQEPARIEEEKVPIIGQQQQQPEHNEQPLIGQQQQHQYPQREQRAGAMFRKHA